MSHIVASSFRRPKHLEVLDLSNNFIESMPSAIFRHLRQLKWLDLARNKIPELVTKVFFGLKLLAYLDIGRNPILSLAAHIFEDTPGSQALKCSACSLHEISVNLLHQLPEVTHLGFSNNKIRSVPKIFIFKKLQSLNLSGNLLNLVSLRFVFSDQFGSYHIITQQNQSYIS